MECTRFSCPGFFGRLLLLLALAVILSGCGLPVAALRGSKLEGATVTEDQYFTLSIFRIADHLATASNQLDQAITDWQRGLISLSYLAIVARRSAASAERAEQEAKRLHSPKELETDVAQFLAAGQALANALEDTAQALSTPVQITPGRLTRDFTAQRQAVSEINQSLSLLEGTSWPDQRGGENATVGLGK